MTCARRRRQPGADPAEQEEPEQDAGYQAAGDQPLPQAGPGDVAACPTQPVTRGQPDHLAEVAEHVDRHGAEPQDETRLVHLEQQRQPGPAHQEQPHPAGQHHQGEDHHGRAEQAEYDRRRSLAPVGRSAAVVTRETPRGAGHLDQHRRYEHHADEDMRREQRADTQDRDALGGQQHQQDGGVGRRQAGIAGHARFGLALRAARPTELALLRGLGLFVSIHSHARTL